VLDLSRIPSAPRTPSARARDLVFRYRGSQGLKLFVGVVFLAAGTLMSPIFCGGVPVDIAISVAGIRTTATVVDTEVQSNVSVNGQHPTLAHLRYVVDGTTYESTASTLDRSRASLALDTEVPIEVVRTHPSWVRLEGETYSSGGYFMMFLLTFAVGATITFGAAMAFGAIRANRRARRAFIHGTPCIAHVVFEGPDTRAQLNGRNPHKIAWEFDVGGRVIEGSITNMRQTALAGLLVGEQIVVLYDPAEPKVHSVYVE